MATELLTDGGFASSLASWNYNSRDFKYTSGWAECTQQNAGTYRIYQDVTVSGGANFSAAVCSSKIKWAITGGATGDSLQFRLTLINLSNGATHQVANSGIKTGSGTSQALADDVDVLDFIQGAGGDGTYRFELSVQVRTASSSTASFSGSFDLNEFQYTGVTSSDTFSDTVTLSTVFSDTAAYWDIFTDTVFVADDGEGFRTIPLVLEYNYYLGSYGGTLYINDDTYHTDNGYGIDAYYVTKQSDFADEYQVCLGRFKTVYRVRLWYTDVSTDSPVIVSVSTDGGETWSSRARSLGDGDGREKSAVFDFHITSDTFKFKVQSYPITQNTGTQATFRWSALEIDFAIGHGYIEQ
jgi:hypothetical protein